MTRMANQLRESKFGRCLHLEGLAEGVARGLESGQWEGWLASTDAVLAVRFPDAEEGWRNPTAERLVSEHGRAAAGVAVSLERLDGWGG